MPRILTVSLLALLAFVRPIIAQGGPQAPDAVFMRAQQMITAGQVSAGRAVLDSVVTATPDDTPRYAEALFWRASFSETSAGAERDYRRIVVEYALSPRAAESLFRLAQLEMTRNDRANARMHLERLQREHPGSPISTRGNVMLAQLAFNDRDDVVGCRAVAAAREGLNPGDVELRNQLDYHEPRCANLAARMAAAARDSSAKTPAAAASTPAGPTTGSTTDTSSPRSTSSQTATSGTTSAREFSVQIAAFDTRSEADALAKRLSGRGYTARVVGERSPYRVRIGRYPTRERADTARRQVGGDAIVVEAEPR